MNKIALSAICVSFCFARCQYQPKGNHYNYQEVIEPAPYLSDSMKEASMHYVTQEDSLNTYGEDYHYDTLKGKYSYRFLKDTTFDDPGKTQINSIIVIDDLKKKCDTAKVKNTLAYIFNSQKRRIGFTYRQHANSYLMFCYASEALVNDGLGEYVSRAVKPPHERYALIELHWHYEKNLR